MLVQRNLLFSELLDNVFAISPSLHWEGIYVCGEYHRHLTKITDML